MPHHIPRADRFLYLPFVGLAVAAAMAARPLSRALTGRFALAGPIVVAGAIIGVLTMLTARQIQTWRNTTTMWEHCVRAAPFNPMAHGLLADVLQEQGRLDEAARHYVISAQQELIMYPERASAHCNWGEHLLQQDKLEEAKACFVRAIEIQPDLAKAHCNLGIVLSRQGKIQEAEEAYREAVKHDPDMALAHLHLGTLLVELGALEAAKEHLSEAVRLDPHDAYTQFNLGIAFCKEQDFGQAAIYLNRALKEDPDFVPALVSLALLRATSNDAAHRNGLEAVELAERACQLTRYEHPGAVQSLAAAYAEAGRFPDAVSAAKHGIRVALASGNGAMADAIRQALELYQQDMPLRSNHLSE
jgi:Tfp pilus assembly protein PilF